VALPSINGEFTVVKDPDIRYSNNGKAWAMIRGVAKDRVRDSNGNWADGDPCFIDIIVAGQAENLYESICKGDSIIVSGKLKARQYDHNGETRTGYSITATDIGVSLRWGAARTQKAIDSIKPGAQAAIDTLGAETLSPDDSEPPF
jgi:single-strand DNA-binding protein